MAGLRRWPLSFCWEMQALEKAFTWDKLFALHIIINCITKCCCASSLHISKEIVLLSSTYCSLGLDAIAPLQMHMEFDID